MTVWLVSRGYFPRHIEEGVFGMGNMLLLLLTTCKVSRLDTSSPDGYYPFGSHTGGITTIYSVEVYRPGKGSG